MNPAARCRLEKEAWPDRFCPTRGCLWRVKHLHGPDTPCRKHPLEPVLKCAVCGEDTTHNRSSSLYGHVHRYGGTDHPFTPRT